jgi:hypothetical protein
LKRKNEAFGNRQTYQDSGEGGRTMRKSSLTISGIAGILALLLCTGCAGTFFKNHGGITPDSEATKNFETCQINPAYNYYISGSDVYPNALMGLNKAYTLDSDLWKKIEPTPQEFREIVQNMQSKALSLGQNQHGFAILDDSGKRIGVWYSLLSVRTVVQKKEGGKVVIHTPDLDTYQRYEDQDAGGSR